MKYLISLGFIVVFLSEIFAQNQSITLKSNQDLFLVGKNTYFFEDKSGNLTINEVSSIDFQKKFQLNDKQVFARPATKSSYWFKLTVENKCHEDIWLEIGSTYAWYIDFYTPDTNNLYTNKIETGTMRPESSKQYPVNLFWLPLNKANQVSPKTYYFKVKESLTFELPLTVGTIRSLSKNKDISDFLTAGFVGLMLIMVLYNSFLYISTRDQIYVLYIGYLIWMGVAMPYANGYPYIQGLDFLISKEIINEYFLVWFSPVCFFIGAFCIKYLDLGENRGKIVRKVIIAEIIILSVIFPIATLIGGKLVDLVSFFQLFLLALYFTCLFTGYNLSLKGNKKAHFYIIGWTFMITSAFIFFAVINGFLPFNSFSRNSLYFGAAIEVWMFSLALGDRMNIIRREKENIQASNLKLVQYHNTMLEQTVNERTKELSIANQEQEAINEELNMLNEELNTTLESVEAEKIKSDRLLRNIFITDKSKNEFSQKQKMNDF